MSHLSSSGSIEGDLRAVSVSMGTTHTGSEKETSVCRFISSAATSSALLSRRGSSLRCGSALQQFRIASSGKPVALPFECGENRRETRVEVDAVVKVLLQLLERAPGNVESLNHLLAR